MNIPRLQSQVAVITGAARGIGYGIAQRFALEGAHVVIADINSSTAIQAAERIESESGVKAIGLECDVVDRTSVNKMFADVLREFGGIDIVAANAGVCPFVEFLDLDVSTWQRTIDINLTGAFHTAQEAARVMIRTGRGRRIIFTTSLSTINAASNQVDYAAAKSGVKMLMASIAAPLGRHNITANAIAPGVIYTEMGAFHWDVPEHREAFAKENPIGRLGTPADIAAAAVFLASEDADYITGSTIRVDGGRISMG